MGSSELSISYKNWAKRIAQYQAAGINASVYTPIAQKDMQRTYSEDAYPMSDLEANIAVSAASQGTPPVTEGPRGTGGHGVLHDIGEVGSNIIPDTQGVITGLLRGAAETGKELVSPSTYKDWAQALTGSNDSPEMQKLAQASGVDLSTYNPNSLSDLGATARMFSNLPLANLIPGISDLANSTTSAGRQSMLQHPVSTALDVAGDIGGVAKAAGTEALARSGDLGDLAAQGVDINNLKALNEALKSDPSAKAALARGHVLLAGGRAVDRGALAKLQGGLEGDILTKDDKTYGPTQRKVKAALRKANIDRISQRLSTSMSRASGDVNRQFSDFTRNRSSVVFKPLLDSDDPMAVENYWKKYAGVGGGRGSMNDMERSVAHDHDALQSELTARVSDKLHQTPEGLFPKNVANKYKKVHAASDAVAKTQDKLTAATEYLAKRQEEFDAKVPKNPDGTPAVDVEAATPGSKVGQARDFLRNAQKKYDKATQNHKVQQETLKTHAANYRKQLRATPPAQHTPLMRQFMRQHAAEAIKNKAEREMPGRASDRVEGQLSNVEEQKRAQMEYLDKVNSMLKDAENTTFNKTLQTYLGSKEYSELVGDSLEYAMKMEAEGRGGSFMHSVRAGDEKRALSTKITTRDPNATMTKGFDIAETLMNAQVAVDAQFVDIAQQEGGLQVWNSAMVPHGKTAEELQKSYIPIAQSKLDRGRARYTSTADLSRKLRNDEWQKVNKKTGLAVLGGKDHPNDFYVPKYLYANWHQFTQGSKLDSVINGKFYSKSMKLFRTSVLYGPRHFAHVVIGGLMPLMMADPAAITNFVTLFPEMWKVWHGEAPDPAKVPSDFLHPISAKSDEGMSHEVDRQIGAKYGSLLKKFWEDTGGRFSEGMARFEDAAQTMYQSAARLQALKRGEDPTIALEMARRLVVNMDSAAPFERTIMKQIMPFYSFTRFATQFLLNYPFDHPLRVSMLSSMSNQAQEEWGTGLPQDMMNLFFINGSDKSPGNVTTVNLKNANPFRSIANQFTLGGFLSSLNPGIQAVANMVGVNTLSGSGEMYPEISYNAQTGSLQTTRPGGDWLNGMESYVPELSVVDGYLGLSDEFRSLKQDDPSAWHREMFSLLNVPFTPSDYNMSQVRGNVGLNIYKGASQAVQDAERTGNFSGNINRYNLVPYNNGSRTLLYTPQQIEEYFKGLQQSAATTNPGINPAALAPTSY